MALAGMNYAGAWLDNQPVLAMATWGGHHRLVAIALVMVLGNFAVLACLTAGFRTGNGTRQTLLTINCLVALISMAGILALILPAVIVSLFTLLGHRRR